MAFTAAAFKTQPTVGLSCGTAKVHFKLPLLSFWATAAAFHFFGIYCGAVKQTADGGQLFDPKTGSPFTWIRYARVGSTPVKSSGFMPPATSAERSVNGGNDADIYQKKPALQLTAALPLLPLAGS